MEIAEAARHVDVGGDVKLVAHVERQHARVDRRDLARRAEADGRHAALPLAGVAHVVGREPRQRRCVGRRAAIRLRKVVPRDAALAARHQPLGVLRIAGFVVFAVKHLERRVAHKARRVVARLGVARLVDLAADENGCFKVHLQHERRVDQVAAVLKQQPVAARQQRCERSGRQTTPNALKRSATH